MNRRRIQRRRSKRESIETEVDYSVPSQPAKNTALQIEPEFIAPQGATVKCPSAKYFVHPRVAFSVRGNITMK